MISVESEKGTYFILAGNGCNLLPGAPHEIRLAAMAGSDFVYWDEMVMREGTMEGVIRKPPWSPDTLLSFNYIGACAAVHESLLNETCTGNYYTKEALYEAFLKLTERTRAISHLEKVLSTISDAFEYQTRSTVSLIHAVLSRRGIKAEVLQETEYVSIEYAVPLDTKISILILMDEASSVYDLKRTLTALACVCTYPWIEYLIADPGAYQEEKERYYRALRREQGANIFCSYGTQFLPDLANDACKAAKGEVLLFLTAGMQPTGGCDIKKMAGYCLQPHIGLASGSVNKINTPYTKNATIVNAPVMVQKSKFEAARGFDATFHQRGYIQALSLTMVEQGLYNVIVPEAVFCHNPKKFGAKPKPDSVNRLRIRDRFEYLKD